MHCIAALQPRPLFAQQAAARRASNAAPVRAQTAAAEEHAADEPNVDEPAVDTPCEALVRALRRVQRGGIMGRR